MASRKRCHKTSSNSAGMSLVVDVLLLDRAKRFGYLGEHRGRSLVTHKEANFLDVECEVGWSALDPQSRVLRRGHRVAASVDFDHGELGGVEAPAILGAAIVARVELLERHQRLVQDAAPTAISIQESGLDVVPRGRGSKFLVYATGR